MSKKTAAAVGKELLKDGVPEDAIFVAGFGKENPIKPTNDGVLSLTTAASRFSSNNM